MLRPYRMGSCNIALDWKWSSVRQFLPLDLDGLAVEYGALTRRRGVAGGEALVRTLLLVGMPKSSLARASLMAGEAGLAKMNSTALFNRLCRSEKLLELLFRSSLSHVADDGEHFGGLRLLAVDSTVLCGPGSKGVDQRLHTVYDLGKGVPLSVELTGPKGGEHLKRHQCFGSGDLILGDRGYGYNTNFHYALSSGARILIRFNFQTVTLFDESGQRIWSEVANGKVPQTGTVELSVSMDNWPSKLRAVGSRNPEGEAVWLLTDLSQEELPSFKVRDLYRKRWQVELYFKRLKSLLDIDELPTRDGPSARAWIWAKLVLSSLAVLMSHERFSPCGAQESIQPMESIRLRHVGNIPNSTRASTKAKKRQTQRPKKKTSTKLKTIYTMEA